MKSGECVTSDEDPDLWFSFDPFEQRIAKELCQKCPVRETCLDFVMNERWFHDGIWGGLTPPERRRLARAQKIPQDVWR